MEFWNCFKFVSIDFRSWDGTREHVGARNVTFRLKVKQSVDVEKRFTKC